MRTFALTFSIAAVICSAAYISLKNTVIPAPKGFAQQEGYGVNPGSRKYFEYMRHHDPATGAVPKNMRNAVDEFATRLPRKSSDRSVTWEARGPINKGGRTRALAIDVTNSNTLLAGSVTGGMWRSTDAGQSWVKTTAPHQMHSVSSVVQDKRPGHENTWYFGTGEEFYGVVSGTSFTSQYSGDGVYKSIDGGVTWSPLLSTSSNTPQNVMQNGSYDFIWNMAMDYSNTSEDEVYAAVYNGVIRSTDGGETWTQVLGFGTTGSEFTDVHVTPTGVVYATMSFANGANNGGIFRSPDGITWTEITPASIYSQRRMVMCQNPGDENEMYFIAEMTNNVNDIAHVLFKYNYISDDGTGAGGAWTDLSANLPDEDCTLQIGTDFDFGTFRSQNSYDLCIAHHPTEDVVFIGGVNINRSMSAFTQDDNDWIGGYRCNIENPLNYSYPSHHSDQHLMVFHPTNPDVMYSANDGGLYRTDNALADSVSWTPLNHGYVTTQFYTVAMEQGYADSDFVFGGMQDNGTWITHSADPSVNWKEVHADDGAYCALPQGRDYIITSSQLGRMYKKTIDAEGNLTGTTRLDATNAPLALFINPFILDPFNNNDLYIAGNKTIRVLQGVSNVPVNGDYITELNSDYWDNIGESLIATSAGAITCLDKAQIDNSIIYYGTSASRIYRLDDCYNAPVKTDISSPLFPANAYTSCVTMNDLDTQEAIASFSNYNVPSIFHTEDGGANWVDISGNLEQNVDGTGNGPAVYWVEIYPGTPKVYFAGTSAGLYSTEVLDGANTVWEMEGAETIGNVVINMIKVRPYDGKIAIATHANGIYTGSLAPVEAASVENIETLKSDVVVYPNPFSDQISWNFATRKSEKITLQIFDLTGKLVHDSGTVNALAGEQKIEWNPASNVIAGTYIYKIKIGSLDKVGKIIYRK